MPGLRGFQHNQSRLLINDLSAKDDVWTLPEGIFKPQGVAGAVQADLALGNLGALVLEDVFDGVFDRDELYCSDGIDAVYDCSQCSRLPAAALARDENQSFRRIANSIQYHRV